MDICLSVTLFLFPKIKPHVTDIIDNEYILNIILSVSIFVIVIFIILLINRSISKVIKYSGIGSLDKFFGFLFGFVRVMLSQSVYLQPLI